MIIQKLRLQRGWSQQQLADVSGISHRTIQRVESGAMPSLETLKSLAAVFETSIEDLKGASAMTAVDPAVARASAPAADPAAPGVSADEALAMRQVRQLRSFLLHVVVYLVVCSAAMLAVWLVSRDNLASAGLLWVVWGAGLALHAARTFLWGGAWERREVERRLGRPL